MKGSIQSATFPVASFTEPRVLKAEPSCSVGTTFCVPTHVLGDTWVGSIFWLL